jgi:hypothetical protein
MACARCATWPSGRWRRSVANGELLHRVLVLDHRAPTSQFEVPERLDVRPEACLLMGDRVKENVVGS